MGLGLIAIGFVGHVGDPLALSQLVLANSIFNITGAVSAPARARRAPQLAAVLAGGARSGRAGLPPLRTAPLASAQAPPGAPSPPPRLRGWRPPMGLAPGP
jgi:hypothetical protein